GVTPRPDAGHDPAAQEPGSGAAGAARAGTGPGAAIVGVLPGLLLTALIATAGFLLAETRWVKESLHVSALLLVILLGIAWKSLAPVPRAALPGIRLAQRPVLRWAVAGLGFRLSLAA